MSLFDFGMEELPADGSDFREENRVVFVRACFREEWVDKRILAPVSGSNFTAFGKWSIPRKFKFVKKRVLRSTSDCEIDGEQLAEDIKSAVLALNQQGFRVCSVTSVSSGQFSPRYDRKVRSRSLLRNAMRQIGYGFSYTDGVIIVAEKM